MTNSTHQSWLKRFSRSVRAAKLRREAPRQAWRERLALERLEVPHCCR